MTGLTAGIRAVEIGRHAARAAARAVPANGFVEQVGNPMSLSFVGRTSRSAADVLVGLFWPIGNRPVKK